MTPGGDDTWWDEEMQRAFDWHGRDAMDSTILNYATQE
jgi:hypothetical protein